MTSCQPRHPGQMVRNQIASLRRNMLPKQNAPGRRRSQPTSCALRRGTRESVVLPIGGQRVVDSVLEESWKTGYLRNARWTRRWVSDFLSTQTWQTPGYCRHGACSGMHMIHSYPNEMSSTESLQPGAPAQPDTSRDDSRGPTLVGDPSANSDPPGKGFAAQPEAGSTLLLFSGPLRRQPTLI
jgi:hypothetical protein